MKHSAKIIRQFIGSRLQRASAARQLADPKLSKLSQEKKLDLQYWQLEPSRILSALPRLTDTPKRLKIPEYSPEIPSHFLTDALSEDVAAKLGIIPIYAKPNRGTIGIAGHFPIENSKLAIELVKAGNRLGYKDDQDHPELVVMNLSASDSSYEFLCYQVRMLSDVGCDVIVIPESDLTQEQLVGLQNETRGESLILFLDQAQNAEDFANQILTKNDEIKDKCRPNIYDAADYQQTLKSLSDDYKKRQIKISRRKSNDYPKIYSTARQDPAVGIVGGAGPMASAEYSLNLAQQGISHIHFSNNSAPYKIRFALKNGHSFLPHYKNTMKALKDMGCTHIAMPCNTAHLFLEIFQQSLELSDLYFIDIRNSVLEHIKATNCGARFLLLGTDATIGIKSDGGYHIGLYDQILQNNGYEIIKPNRHQQDQVMKAIFLGKEGEMDQARKIIESVIADIKIEYGPDIDVALVCTDLPIAFGVNQLNQINAISTIKTLSDFTRGALQDAKLLQLLQEEVSDLSDNSDEEIEKNNLSEIYSIVEKYSLSFSKKDNQIRIHFGTKDDLPIIKSEKAADMSAFRDQFCFLDGLSSRFHPNQGYITFICQNNISEKFKNLEKLLEEFQIPENKETNKGNAK